MGHTTEKTITVKFYHDGKVSVEANGYDEALDPSFSAGLTSDIDSLRYKQACLADCHAFIKQLGKLESISPKQPSPSDSMENRIRLR